MRASPFYCILELWLQQPSSLPIYVLVAAVKRKQVVFIFDTPILTVDNCCFTGEKI